MKARAALLVIVAAAALATPDAAVAKGPIRGFVFDGYFVPGQRISSVEVLRLSGARFMRRAPYFAFLRNPSEIRYNLGWPSPPLGRPRPLGSVDLRPFRFQGEPRVEVRLTFRVPDVPTGIYDVVVCDAACEQRVGRLRSSRLYVVATRSERRLYATIDELGSELGRWEGRVIRLDGEKVNRWVVRELSDSIGALEARIDALHSDLGALRDEIDEGAAAPASRATVLPTIAVLLTTGAGGLLAGLLVTRRRRAAAR